MADDMCNCRDSTDAPYTDPGTDTGEWIPGRGVLDTELPSELQASLSKFVGTDTVETLGEWAAIVRHHVDGDAVSKADLCLTERHTGHVGTIDGETFHFACFYDAIILAALEDRAVDIRTKSPDGTMIEARAVGTDDVIVTPQDAVFSFGIEEDSAPRSSDEPSLELERGYAAMCPYIKAFPTRAAYDRWASSVPAATIALPLAGATQLAGALVE